MKKQKTLLLTSLVALSAVMVGCRTDRPEVEQGFVQRAENMMGNPGAQVSVHQIRTQNGHEVRGNIRYINEKGAYVSERFSTAGSTYMLATDVVDNRGVVIQPPSSATPWMGVPGFNEITIGTTTMSRSEYGAERAVRAAQEKRQKEAMEARARAERNAALTRGL